MCSHFKKNNSSSNTLNSRKHGSRITFVASGDRNRYISCRPTRTKAGIFLCVREAMKTQLFVTVSSQRGNATGASVPRDVCVT